MLFVVDASLDIRLVLQLLLMELRPDNGQDVREPVLAVLRYEKSLAKQQKLVVHARCCRDPEKCEVEIETKAAGVLAGGVLGDREGARYFQELQKSKVKIEVLLTMVIMVVVVAVVAVVVVVVVVVTEKARG